MRPEQQDSKELVSCLTITRDDRLRELARSIRGFVRQSHDNRELVIVHDGSAATDRAICDLVSHYPGDRFLVHREKSPRALGTLRNLSVELARGALVCQWDDDDLYHPQRLQRQYQHLAAERADFCFLTDQLHWFEQLNHLYWDDWNVERYPMNLIQGTLMGYRDKMGSYPDVPRGEDTPLVVEIVNRGARVAALSQVGYLYVYVFNGRNAWDYPHHAAISAWKRLRRPELERRAAVLSRHLADYEWPVDTLRMPHDDGVLEFDVEAATLT